MGPRGHFYSGMSLAIRDIWIFRGLTGSQRTLGFWGVIEVVYETRENFKFKIFKKKEEKNGNLPE